MIAQQSGADSAAVIYDALQSAQAKNIDLLIALACGIAAVFLAQTALAKKKIESITDLPVPSYPTDLAPSRIPVRAAS